MRNNRNQNWIQPRAIVHNLVAVGNNFRGRRPERVLTGVEIEDEHSKSPHIGTETGLIKLLIRLWRVELLHDRMLVVGFDDEAGDLDEISARLLVHEHRCGVQQHALRIVFM